MSHRLIAIGRSQTILWLVVLCLPVFPLQASPITFDLYGLIRAGRWNEIEAHFREATPGRGAEQYASAMSIIRQMDSNSFGNEASRAFSMLLSVIGPGCNRPQNQTDLIACVEELPGESIAEFLPRLAALRALELARKMNLREFEAALFLRVSGTTDDPVTREIMTERLKWLVQTRQNSMALETARRFPGLSDTSLDLWRARGLVAGGAKEDAWPLYISSAHQTQAPWLINAILVDVRKNYPASMNAAALGQRSERNRELLVLSEKLSDNELNALKRGMTPVHVMQTTNALRIHRDGIYLIRAGHGAHIPTLAKNAYTHLSHSPDILYDWAAMLRSRREHNTAMGLLRDFEHALPQKYSLWAIYLHLLKDHGPRAKYFEQVLAYLGRFPEHYSVADDLIGILIGSDASEIRWANAALWEQANASVPQRTGTGRFLYWLKRYYIQTGQNEKLDQLYDQFYARAPGSFYAGAFWESRAPGDIRDYAREWQQVQDRDSYLRWVSRHGGNEQAVRFLRGRSLHRFRNTEADQMWQDMTSGQFDPPEPMLLLYKLGEESLGQKYFAQEYTGKVTERENLARMAVLGQKTGTLPTSVYFTRQLARDIGVPEDPFSMPGDLLKQLYPRPHYTLVNRYARQYNIEEEMVYALMRQESMFRESAVSRSGARGLMQIMPRTGAWLHEKMGRTNRLDLMDPDTNIELGAKYFSDLIGSTGHFRWAAIAYNGGPGNLRRWKARYYENDDFYFFLENIPHPEPRNYCRITYQNYWHYRVTNILYR